jgi:hypothetical protein
LIAIFAPGELATDKGDTLGIVKQRLREKQRELRRISNQLVHALEAGDQDAANAARVVRSTLIAEISSEVSGEVTAPSGAIVFDPGRAREVAEGVYFVDLLPRSTSE